MENINTVIKNIISIVIGSIVLISISSLCSTNFEEVSFKINEFEKININNIVVENSPLPGNIGEHNPTFSKNISLKGKGTQEEPFIIEDIYDFIYFGKTVDEGESYKNKFLVLNCDIDFNELNSNKDFIWNPIGSINEGYSFLGTFDGNNKTISNLVIKNCDSGGLFECIGLDNNNAIVKNLKIVNASVSAYSDAGILSTYVMSSEISNIIIIDSCISGLDIGTFSAYAFDCKIIGCEIKNVTGADDYFSYSSNTCFI